MKSFKEYTALVEAITIGKAYDINKFDTLKNMRTPTSVKVVDYIKKAGKDPEVVYSLNGKKKSVSAKVFKQMMVEAKKQKYKLRSKDTGKTAEKLLTKKEAEKLRDQGVDATLLEKMSDHDFVTDIVWDVKTEIDPDKDWDKFKAEVIKQAKKKKVKTDGYMIADILDESVKTSQDLTEGMMGDTVTAVLGAIAGFGGTALGDKLKDHLSQQYRIKNLSMDQVNKIKSDGESWQVLKKGDKRVTNRMIKQLNKLDAALDKGADAKSVLAIMDEVTALIQRDAAKAEEIHYENVREYSDELLRAYYINKNDTDLNDPTSAAERKQQTKNYKAMTALLREYQREVHNRWNGQSHKNISKLEDNILKHAKEHAKVENRAKTGSDKSFKIWTKKRAESLQKLEAEIKKYQGK